MHAMFFPSPKATPGPSGEERRTLLWAGIRLALGTAQVTGASMGAVFLIRTGASKVTFITVAITAGFTLASRLLFRGRPGPGGPAK